MTSASTTVVDRQPRVIGVEVARGKTLIGIMATHVFDTLDDNNDPTVAHVVAGGRAATTFVLIAGVSLAFLSGGSPPSAARVPRIVTVCGHGYRLELPAPES